MHIASHAGVNVTKKKHCADHASDILLCTSISKYILVYDVSYNLTPHFTFESGLIRLATPTGLCSTLLQCLACMGLPHCSLLECQSSQAGPSAPKKPQVDLIDIAAPPSVCSCCICSCRLKYRLCYTSIAYDILVYNSIAQCVLV
jgi:hypothetical protein